MMISSPTLAIQRGRSSVDVHHVELGDVVEKVALVDGDDRLDPVEVAGGNVLHEVLLLTPNLTVHYPLPLQDDRWLNLEHNQDS